jgi:hypothetical protein
MICKHELLQVWDEKGYRQTNEQDNTSGSGFFPNPNHNISYFLIGGVI